jgi:cytosine/uracil/thiamine/allantoin permease
MGLSVPQAILIIVVSSILIALFSTLIAWVGLKWHIGFTVQNRYSWGMWGSFIPLLQRILLNFIWNAIQCKQAYYKSELGIRVLIQIRLEWRPSGRRMLDCDLAFVRTHAEYLQP